MASVIQIDAKRVPREILRRGAAVQDALLRGSHRGAERARALMVVKTPTDTGQLRASWVVKRGKKPAKGQRKIELAVLINDAPHAGIVERGARPHGVNRAGVEALLRWVKRHFPTHSDEEQVGIVWGIVRKLRTKGQKPTHFVKDNKPQAERLLASEIERAIRMLSTRRVS